MHGHGPREQRAVVMRLCRTVAVVVTVERYRKGESPQPVVGLVGQTAMRRGKTVVDLGSAACELRRLTLDECGENDLATGKSCAENHHQRDIGSLSMKQSA